MLGDPSAFLLFLIPFRITCAGLVRVWLCALLARRQTMCYADLWLQDVPRHNADTRECCLPGREVM